MPVSKKRHPKKRRKKENLNVDGYIVALKLKDCGIPDDLREDIHNQNVFYYEQGKADRASGQTALTLHKFIERFDVQVDVLSGSFKRILPRAQYSQYLDGFNGADYRDHVIIKEDYNKEKGKKKTAANDCTRKPL